MEDAANNEPAPPSSSAPPSLVHCTMTIRKACAQYMAMVQEEREKQFREAQADAAYNHHLLQEHLHAQE
jgi:hypothetical protein